MHRRHVDGRLLPAQRNVVACCARSPGTPPPAAAHRSSRPPAPLRHGQTAGSDQRWGSAGARGAGCRTRQLLRLHVHRERAGVVGKLFLGPSKAGMLLRGAATAGGQRRSPLPSPRTPPYLEQRRFAALVDAGDGCKGFVFAFMTTRQQGAQQQSQFAVRRPCRRTGPHKHLELIVDDGTRVGSEQLRHSRQWTRRRCGPAHNGLGSLRRPLRGVAPRSAPHRAGRARLTSFEGQRLGSSSSNRTWTRCLVSLLAATRNSVRPSAGRTTACRGRARFAL